MFWVENFNFFWVCCEAHQRLSFIHPNETSLVVGVFNFVLTYGRQQINFKSNFIDFLGIFCIFSMFMIEHVNGLKLLLWKHSSIILSKLENTAVVGSYTFCFNHMITWPLIIIKSILENVWIHQLLTFNSFLQHNKNLLVE